VAAPGHGATLDELRKELGLLLEELLVVGEVESEERERLDARAATEDHLGPPVGRRMKSGEALEYADGIIRAENRDCGSDTDARRPCGDGRQHDVAGGHREVFGVVLADSEEIDARLFREHTLLDHAADRLRV